MKTFVRDAAVLAISLAGFALTLASPASAEAFSCHIGKPSYCFKYGGGLCEKWNNAPDKPASCEKWTAGCIDCHNNIPDCLGNRRPPSDSPVCTECEAKWRACMHTNDSRFWPNRMSGPPDDNHGKN